MTDPEIEELRDKVHCAVVLERNQPPWKLDRKESTRLSLKYRRGKGEILIVSHGGKGWWDPTTDAKGDVFRLVQRLEPGLTFGHVRKRLREFAGLSPSYPIANRAGGRRRPDLMVAQRWAERNPVRPNSPTWQYLLRKRYLPTVVIEAASAARVLREGPVGSAWFAHLDDVGGVAMSTCVDRPIKLADWRNQIAFSIAAHWWAPPEIGRSRGGHRRAQRRRH